MVQAIFRLLISRRALGKNIGKCLNQIVQTLIITLIINK